MAVIILGMHQSGASDLARVLSFHGFSLPSDATGVGLGHCGEALASQGVVALNERILASLGGRWDAPGPFILPGLLLAESQEIIARILCGRWLDQAAATLEVAYGDAAAIVLSDPRLCLMLPLWQSALIKAGYETRCILCYRHPLDVAASLAERHRVVRSRSLQLWAYYSLEPLIFAQAFIEGAVLHDDLLDDHVKALSPVFARIGLPVPLTDDQARAASAQYLDQAGRLHVADKQNLGETWVSDLVASVWRLLNAWNRTMSSRAVLAQTISGVRKNFGDAAIFAGMAQTAWGVFTKADRQRSSAAAIASEAHSRSDGGSDRTVILHYHLFKNAGTSVDEVLQSNFGDAWGEQEFEIPRDRKSADFPFNTGKVCDYLRQHPELKALSSHTALLPVPELEGMRVFPILFIRHPIDRLKSAYLFEVSQDSWSYGARLAKMQGFAGYLRALIHHPIDRSARNFQTYRLSMNEPEAVGSELQRAMQVRGGRPGFVGLVEAYDASIIRLEAQLALRLDGFRTFAVHANASQSPRVGLGEKLALIRSEIGDALFADVVAANADDIALFEVMAARYL
jgi:hypothetical protein